MKINEKFLKGATGAAYFTGILMEFVAVAALEADVISAFSFWLMASAGALLSAGALFCARAAAEYFWRQEIQERRLTRRKAEIAERLTTEEAAEAVRHLGLVAGKCGYNMEQMSQCVSKLGEGLAAAAAENENAIVAFVQSEQKGRGTI